MPTPSILQLLKERELRYTTVPDKLVTQMSQVQNDVFKEVEKILSQFEYEGGNLVLSEYNVNLINSIDAQINQAIYNDTYIDSLTEYTSQFRQQQALTNKYFTELNIGFGSINPIDTVLTSQKNAIQLLGDDAYTQIFLTPLKEGLNSSVTSGASFTDTLSTLRDFTIGNENVDGKITSHVKRVAYDAFAVSDRNYTASVSSQLGIEFYLYFGGEIEDTREFCAERHGKYYHKKEIEGWGEGKRCCGLEYPQGGTWQGRNSATNKSTIFSLAGGYNCKHSILPVSISEVPESVIKRNLENGNYKVNS